MIHKFKIPPQVYHDLFMYAQDKSIEYNNSLAGHIKEEYSLNKYRNIFENFIQAQIQDSDYLRDYFLNLQILHPNPQSLTLASLWVNYQKKHEFNPIHKHNGLFSFILFIKIPFKYEDEIKLSPGLKSNNNLPGNLCFIYNSAEIEGGIKVESHAVDQTWEGTGMIFKSSLNHCVYPFYSDGTRITISGNLSLDNRKLNV
jgi:hypothetical protein